MLLVARRAMTETMIEGPAWVRLAISTRGSRGSTVPIAHWRGDLMSNGNFADFARRGRGFASLARHLYGNQK